MKPPKPRITKPRLCWKWAPRKEAWEPYHRITWRDAGKRKERLILLDWQGNAETLDTLYWACEAGRHDTQKTVPLYTWGEAIRTWRADPRVQGKLADSTKRSYRRDMDRIMEKNDVKDMRRTSRQAVRAAHGKLSSTPRKADKHLQTISLLWNYAKTKLDWPLGENPASGIDHYGPQKEWQPWPEWMIDKLPASPLNVRTLAELILGTGQRPGAAVTMTREHFKGEWMDVLDEKSDEFFETYCPDRLREYIDALPHTGKHVLAKNLTQPLGYDAVEKQFRNWRKTLGDNARPYVLHGLRKLAIIQLAEAGASDAEIQAVTNQSAEMVAFYRKKASRKKLSRSAQKKRK